MPLAFRVLKVSIVLIVTLLGSPGRAELWSNFYFSNRNTVPAPTGKPLGCFEAIIEAQRRYQIPDNLLLAIGLQEAGRRVDGHPTVWPWAVNAEGRGLFFSSRDTAIEWVKAQQSQGVRSIDVGCMQINLRWHDNAFKSVEDAFDPTKNAIYAASFLSELKRSEGSWWRAAGSYHSKTDVHRDRYLASLSQNLKVANAYLDQMHAIARHQTTAASHAKTERLAKPTVLWGSPQSKQNAYSIYTRQPLISSFPSVQEGN